MWQYMVFRDQHGWYCDESAYRHEIEEPAEPVAPFRHAHHLHHFTRSIRTLGHYSHHQSMDRDHIHQEDKEWEDIVLSFFVLIEHNRLAFSRNEQTGNTCVPYSSFIFKYSICQPILKEIVAIPCILSVSLSINEIWIVISSIIKLRWNCLVSVIVPINIVKFEIMISVPTRSLSIRYGSTQPGTVISDPVLRMI